MASRFSLLLLALLSLLSLSADARPGVHFHPCNTLVISTYSFSLRNPNPDLRRPGVVTFFAGFRPDADVLRHRHRHHRFFLPASRLIPYQRVEQLEHQQLRDKVELPISLGFSSLKDRTKDILNVVASLLLGAACGALTAGTMYLIWSLFNHSNGSYRSLDGFSSDDDDAVDHDDDIFNPKKKGYVAVPAAPAKTVDSEAPTADSAAPVKESA